MSQPKHGTLRLLDDFPPVPTAAWEEAIAKDLKGADYEKRLVWNTDEGIPVRPYYRAEHAPAREPLPRPSPSWEMMPPGAGPPPSVSAVAYHEAGATAVQELALAVAEGVERLTAGGTVETVAFGTGSNHFMEIAKLRAFRLLWAQAEAAFGRAPSPVRVHAQTAGENKTLFDPYVNMLRVTTEALSAVLGGCDALTITPCGFDAHLADNVHHILREESHLDKVRDPAAGSYYVEALTEAVAREAWALFQRIEAAGGLAAWRATGALDAELARAREAKEKAVASRRRVLVGTNNYPNVGERRLHEAGSVPGGWRLASAFEAIRLRTERHAAATGRTPRVLLLEHGDLKMRMARAAFCLNLFGCGGFEILRGDSLVNADLVVLCSSDAEYLELARDVCARTKAPVVVAGHPKDQIDALAAAGVAGFVHTGSNAVETLVSWQNRLGLED